SLADLHAEPAGFLNGQTGQRSDYWRLYSRADAGARRESQHSNGKSGFFGGRDLVLSYPELCGSKKEERAEQWNWGEPASSADLCRAVSDKAQLRSEGLVCELPFHLENVSLEGNPGEHGA